MANKNVGALLEYGPPVSRGAGSSTKKEQAVIVTIPLEVKKYLKMLVMSNSIIWVMTGFAVMIIDGPLDTWMVVVLAIAIFWCIIIIPFFVNFIIKIDWGQRGG